MIEKIPAYPTPMIVDYMQADSPVMAEGDLYLAQQTQAVAFRCSGNYASSFYFASGVSGINMPRALVSAVQTWTDVDIGNFNSSDRSPFEFPFRLTEGYSGIGAMISVIVPAKSKLGLRIQTKTLAGHAVTTTNGDPVYLSPGMPDNNIPTLNISSQTIGGWTAGTATCRLVGPDLGASGTRRFVVSPQVYVTDAAHPLITLAGAVAGIDGLEVFIRGVTLFEFPPDAVGA